MKIRKTILNIIIIILVIIICSANLNNVYATGSDVTDSGFTEFYNPTGTMEGYSTFTDMAKVILSIIRVLGTVIAVVTLMVIGIRYMFGSTSEKANYKETMVPYLIGAIMLFTIPNILGIIFDLVTGIKF